VLGPPDDDDDVCSCGVRMDVIGPPGPRHAPGCPHEDKPRPPLSAQEKRELMSSPITQSLFDYGLVVDDEP
jgi:hypothetical protein